jgi:hypothetical protein
VHIYQQIPRDIYIPIEMMVFEEDAACMGIPDGFCIVNLFNLDAICLSFMFFFFVYVYSSF